MRIFEDENFENKVICSYIMNQGSDQLDSRFTLIRFWFEIESTNDSQMSESR